jgi:hypothetical protein
MLTGSLPPFRPGRRYAPLPRQDGQISRLVVAVALGAVLAFVAAFLLSSELSGVANGTPSNASLYQYGNR